MEFPVYRKTIFIFLFCSCLLLINHIYPVIHIVPPFSSKSPPNPHPKPHFISTQTLKEQILKLPLLNATIDSLKKSNTHILDLLNHQDLNTEQKNALRKCGYMAIRSAKQLQEANRQLDKAIFDLDKDSDSFLDYEIACTRFIHIDEYLFVAWEDQHTCLQQFSHVGMMDHHEERSEGQVLLKSFVFDLKIPTFLNLSHSLEMAKEIEKDCRDMLDMMKLSIQQHSRTLELQQFNDRFRISAPHSPFCSPYGYQRSLSIIRSQEGLGRVRSLS